MIASMLRDTWYNRQLFQTHAERLDMHKNTNNKLSCCGVSEFISSMHARLATGSVGPIMMVWDS